MKTRELIDEASSLPFEERAKVIDSLLQTLNPVDNAHAAEWLNLAQRRLAELRSGQVTPVPGEEVFGRIQQRFSK